MLSGKVVEAGTSSGSESSRRVSRKSATNSTRAKTPPSPRMSLVDGGALAPLSRGRPIMSPRSSAENGHDDLMEILTKQRDTVAREGVDAYIHQRRVTSGRSPMTAGSVAIDAAKQKKSITDSYDSIVAPRSQRSVGNLSARRAQAKNNAPIEDITLSIPDKKKKKNADDSLDFDDSNLGDLGDLDDLLSSAPASARKSPRSKRGGSTLGSPADGDLTMAATRMLEGAFPNSPRQPSSVTPKARSPSAAAPAAWSPRPGVDSLSTFPDSTSTWGTLASAAASPAPSARNHTGSISPQSSRLPSISAHKKTPVAPTGVTSSRRPPTGDSGSPPANSKPPTVTSSRSPAGSNPTPATTTTTTSTKTPRQEKPPTSEKPPGSSRKSAAQPTSAQDSSSAKKIATSPAPPTVDKRLPSLSAERSPNKEDALGGTVTPKNSDPAKTNTTKKPTALSPRLPSDSKPDKDKKSATTAADSSDTPKVSGRKNSARVTSVVISEDKITNKLATSGRKEIVTEIIPAEVAPPASKPPLKGTPSKTAAPGAKGARKSVAVPADKAAPAAPGAGKKSAGSTPNSRKPSVADIVLQTRGGRAPSVSEAPTASPGAARKSVTSVGGDATLADLLWGDSLYTADPVPLPISSSDFTDSTIPSTTFYPIPYLQKLDEIRTRVRVSNEQGKFTDDELKRVQGWEVIGDDLKEVVARCIEELIAKELSHKEEYGGSSGSKHKLVLWDSASKKAYKSSRGGASAPAPTPKGKTSKPPAKAPASSTSIPAVDSLVGKLGDDYAASGLDSRILRLSEKAVKTEAIEVAAIASLQGPSPYYRKDPLLLPTKSVQEDDEKFGNILRALAGFDSDALKNVVVDRKSISGMSATSEDESVEYFKDQFYELTVVGDGRKGNLRLVKAVLQASMLGMVVSTTGKASSEYISLRECCEERGIVASSISDGSMEFIPELLLQYVLGEENKPIAEDGDDEEDDGDFTLDMYDVFTSAMFQQQYRIPLVEILMDLLVIPPPGKTRTPAQRLSLSGQNKLFRELMKIKGELKETWIEFFHDICDVKKAIPRELRGRRIHLIRKMLGLQDVAVVANSNGALMPTPSGIASSIKVANAAQHWLGKWTPSSTSSVLALRAILQGNDASPEVGPTTGKSLISATTRFWKYLLQSPSPPAATAPVDDAAPIFVFGPWDLELWKTHGDGYDVVSRAARDNDVDLLPALQEGLERLPPSWAVSMLLPKSSQAIITSTGTVYAAAVGDDEEGGGDVGEIEAKWPLELYVGIEYDEDAIEDIRNDFATAETSSIPPASLASYYRAIYLPPTVSPIPYNGPFVAPSRMGTTKKDARIATLFDQLILKRGRDDMTPLFTAALSNAGLAVSWILETLDHLPNHTTFADKKKAGNSTRWLAVAMVQLPCQIDGLGNSLDMCASLNKDDAVVVSLEEFATMED